jgi:hypothetical protein
MQVACLFHAWQPLVGELAPVSTSLRLKASTTAPRVHPVQSLALCVRLTPCQAVLCQASVIPGVGYTVCGTAAVVEAT